MSSSYDVREQVIISVAEALATVRDRGDISRQEVWLAAEATAAQYYPVQKRWRLDMTTKIHSLALYRAEEMWPDD